MIRKLLILILVSLSIISCEKDESSQVNFTPTNFIIGEMGSQMRFSIKVPSGDFYSFSADSSVLTAIGGKFHEYLIHENEIKSLVQNLSDTIIFKWEVMTAVSPYPEDECELHATQSGYGGFMCSIGKSKTTSNIIKELSKSVSGLAKDAFDEIANYFSD